MSGRIKVVHVHKIAGVSGSERHVLDLLRSLDRTVFEPVFLMLAARARGDEAYAEQFRKAGVRVCALRIRADADPWLFARLVAWFRHERPDVVHTHLIHADVHAIPAARLARVPVVVSTKHNDDRFRTNPAVTALERWLLRRTDRTVAISEALRRFTIDSTGCDPGKVVTVQYGYDAHADVAPLAAPSPVPRGVPAVLAVGRLVEQKGHDVLIKAFARIGRDFPAARLVIVGEGPLRPILERAIEERGLGQSVVLAGRRDDVRAFMPDAAVLAHPSRWEGFGLVLLEAMAAGLPIVATRVSAIPEIVEDGVTGFLVPVDDDAALAESLARLLGDPPLARQLGRAGGERLEREFSLSRMVRAIEAIYRGALAVRAGADIRRMNERVC